MQFQDDRTLAREYHHAVHAADSAGVNGEPEAQLTTPISNLFGGITRIFAIGRLECIRESRRDELRPDFAFLLNGRHVGYCELKKPSYELDITLKAGWTANQRESLLDLDSLVLCNGREAKLYARGELKAAADLPYEDAESWNPRALESLLRTLGQMKTRDVTRVRDLAERLARRTASLRDRILDLLEDRPPSPASGVKDARQARDAWKQYVQPSAKDRDFADGVSQVVAYGLVMSALDGQPDRNQDGRITVEEARDWLRDHSPVISASFGPLLGMPALAAAVRSELAALEDLCSAIRPDRIRSSSESRGEPWLYFYEDFLAVYDPKQRRQTGVYYTPVEVVSAMVRITESLLTGRMGRRLGFGDPDVVTLDPATGTGTFPLGVVDAALCTARDERGASGPDQARANLWRNLLAFEILPGPYGVANLRIAERLRGASQEPAARPQVVLTDTLESPLAGPPQMGLFGDAQVMHDEQERARAIKSQRRVTVIIGNPPYRRVDKKGSGRGGGGWVLDGPVPGRQQLDQSLFDDILDVAKRHTIFSHHASLYNLYVYFWRWAIWKAFEAHGPGPGIVAFITGSSWLTGPGFVGLRKLVREVADEAWILDLGGDNKGAVTEQNVFAIETPVAVAILARYGEGDRTQPARIRYRRIQGDRAAKLEAMKAIGDSERPLDGPWQDVPSGWLDRMVPDTGTGSWDAMPALADLMPWQQPGCKFNRLWPIGPDARSLEERWKTFVSAPVDKDRNDLLARGRDPGPSRETLFQTAATGRSIETHVPGLERLADLRADAPSRPVVRYGYRSFDRQWAFDDPRLAALERPALWQSVSDRQVFLVTSGTGEFGSGPVTTVTEAVPDLHHYCGRGGKDILPLYRDRACQKPNVTTGLLPALGRLLGMREPSPEDLAAYLYALLSTPAYQERFAAELQTPGPRVPLTRDPALWTRAVDIGRRLLWLHTFAERFRDPGAGRDARVPKVAGLEWVSPVRRMPATPRDISYDPATGQIRVGDGVVAGVRPEVWDYTVSGMQVVSKWLGYRTRSRSGRVVSSPNPLDKIRPGEWLDAWNDELLDLLRVLTLTVEGFPDQLALLGEIVSGPLIMAGELPVPGPEERNPPPTEKRFDLGELFG